MYLSYTEYVEMGGTLDTAAFALLSIEAESLINYVTFDRLVNDETVPDRVKQAMFALIDLADKKQQAMVLGKSNDSAGANITSQSNDGVSVTYSAMSASTMFATCKSEMQSVAKLYLSGVKNQAGRLVLYRGLYPDE